MADMPTGAPAPATPAANANSMPSGKSVDALNTNAGASKAPSATDLKTAVTAPVDAAAADKVKASTAAEKEVIRKIKVGDTEYDETTLQKMIQKAEGSEKKFLEGAKMRKEAIRFFKMAKENPKEFLRKTGMDPKTFAYDEVAQDIKDKLRDPKEVALEQAEKRLKEYEARETAEKNRVQEEKLSKEAKALEQKLHSEMIDALEAFPELPKNGFTVAALARAIDTVREKTGVLLSAKEVAPKVVQDIRNQVMGVVRGASPEQVEALLGSEIMAALRKHDMSKLKDPLKGGQGASQESGDKPKAKRYSNSHDFWKTIDKAAKEERGH